MSCIEMHSIVSRAYIAIQVGLEIKVKKSHVLKNIYEMCCTKVDILMFLDNLLNTTTSYLT